MMLFRVTTWLRARKRFVKRGRRLSPAIHVFKPRAEVGGSVGTSARPHPSMCLRPALLGSQSSRADRTVPAGSFDVRTLSRFGSAESDSCRENPPMPLRNRVTPLGDVIVAPERGLVYGNRGCLHNSAGDIVRRAATKRWIACQLSYRGWYQGATPRPGRFTGLFFLDDATAFAAGHRPCALCRRDDYRRVLASPARGGADALDARPAGATNGAASARRGRVASRRRVRHARGRAASRRRWRGAAVVRRAATDPRARAPEAAQR